MLENSDYQLGALEVLGQFPYELFVQQAQTSEQVAADTLYDFMINPVIDKAVELAGDVDTTQGGWLEPPLTILNSIVFSELRTKTDLLLDADAKAAANSSIALVEHRVFHGYTPTPEDFARQTDGATSGSAGPDLEP